MWISVFLCRHKIHSCSSWKWECRGLLLAVDGCGAMQGHAWPICDTGVVHDWPGGGMYLTQGLAWLWHQHEGVFGLCQALVGAQTRHSHTGMSQQLSKGDQNLGSFWYSMEFNLQNGCVFVSIFGDDALVSISLLPFIPW
ncbi:hypothetical protein E3N88_11824 [Mikania micrantha]|uniref:Uncharacterized protein n=1 Tax=Mikania micrantha TaxID=192012 RepID=A0A5N6P6T2_9ASTR|nr:hypothetical protein E3N88_11824 [Mikania micrantha]